MRTKFLDDYVEMHDWLAHELPENRDVRMRLRYVDSMYTVCDSEEEVADKVLGLFFGKYSIHPTLTSLPADNDYAKMYYELADGRDEFFKQYAALHTKATNMFWTGPTPGNNDDTDACCIQ